MKPNASTVYPDSAGPPPFPNEVIKKLSDEEALSWVSSRTSESDQGRDPTFLSLQKNWFIAIAHYLGITDFTSLHLAENIDKNLLPVDTQYSVNLIYRIVLGLVAQLSRAEPMREVIAATPDVEDQIAAKVGEKFIQHYDELFRTKKMRTAIATWLATCGHCFVETYWDKHVGHEVVTYKNPYNEEEVSTNRLGQEERDFLDRVGGIQKTSMGELDSQVLGPFQVTVPEGGTELEKLPWLIIERSVPYDWIWDRYPKKAPDLSSDDLENSIDGYYWQRLTSLVHRHGFSLTNTGQENREMVIVRDLWVPPSNRYPTGFFVRATKSMLLENSPHPMELALKTHGKTTRQRDWRFLRFPLSDCKYAEVPGRFWGMGVVEQLIGPQNSYNTARDQMNRQRDILAHPQWLSPKQAKLTSTRMEYGDLMEYDASQGSPHLVQPPALSAHHMASLERDQMDMQNIAAQSEATQANVPQSARSGVAIRALQEKDELVMNPAIDSLEEMFSKMASQQLALTWLFEKGEVMVRSYGTFRSADVHIFKGIELRGNVHVRVRPGSMVPRSKAAAMQILMDSVQAGIVDPMNPEHQEMIWETMEFGNLDSIFHMRALDRRRADIENTLFIKPQVENQTGNPMPWPDVDDEDDHNEHLRRHILLRKSDVFERWPIMRKMAFDAHMMKHKQAIAAAMQAEMAMQQMAAGGAGGGSPPAEPGEASQPAERQPTPGTEAKPSPV